MYLGKSSIVSNRPKKERVGYNISEGKVFQYDGLHEKAIEMYDRALEFDPDNAVALAAKGNCLRKLNMNEEAIQCFDKLVSLDEQTSDSWVIRGCCLVDLGQNGEALASFKKAIAVNKTSFRAWKAMGLVLMTDSAQEALECFEQAEGYGSYDIMAGVCKARCLLMLGRALETVDCCQRLLNIGGGKNMDIWQLIGEAFSQLGQQKIAERAFEKAFCLSNQDLMSCEYSGN